MPRGKRGFTYLGSLTSCWLLLNGTDCVSSSELSVLEGSFAFFLLLVCGIPQKQIERSDAQYCKSHSQCGHPCMFKLCKDFLESDRHHRQARAALLVVSLRQTAPGTSSLATFTGRTSERYPKDSLRFGSERFDHAILLERCESGNECA